MHTQVLGQGLYTVGSGKSHKGQLLNFGVIKGLIFCIMF